MADLRHLMRAKGSTVSASRTYPRQQPRRTQMVVSNLESLWGRSPPGWDQAPHQAGIDGQRSTRRTSGPATRPEEDRRHGVGIGGSRLLPWGPPPKPGCRSRCRWPQFGRQMRRNPSRAAPHVQDRLVRVARSNASGTAACVTTSSRSGRTSTTSTGRTELSAIRLPMRGGSGRRRGPGRERTPSAAHLGYADRTKDRDRPLDAFQRDGANLLEHDAGGRVIARDALADKNLTGTGRRRDPCCDDDR
jgi:hypothetical protein